MPQVIDIYGFADAVQPLHILISNIVGVYEHAGGVRPYKDLGQLVQFLLHLRIGTFHADAGEAVLYNQVFCVVLCKNKDYIVPGFF